MIVEELIEQLSHYDPQTLVVLERTNTAPVVQLGKDEIDEDLILILE